MCESLGNVSSICEGSLPLQLLLRLSSAAIQQHSQGSSYSCALVERYGGGRAFKICTCVKTALSKYSKISISCNCLTSQPGETVMNSEQDTCSVSDQLSTFQSSLIHQYTVSSQDCRSQVTKGFLRYLIQWWASPNLCCHFLASNDCKPFDSRPGYAYCVGLLL